MNHLTIIWIGLCIVVGLELLVFILIFVDMYSNAKKRNKWLSALKEGDSVSLTIKQTKFYGTLLQHDKDNKSVIKITISTSLLDKP